MGDACVGLAALGEFGSLAEASEASVRIESVMEPRRERAALYDDMFSLYTDLYGHMKPAFKRLKKIDSGD